MTFLGRQRLLTKCICFVFALRCEAINTQGTLSSPSTTFVTPDGTETMVNIFSSSSCKGLFSLSRPTRLCYFHHKASNLRPKPQIETKSAQFKGVHYVSQLPLTISLPACGLSRLPLLTRVQSTNRDSLLYDDSEIGRSGSLGGVDSSGSKNVSGSKLEDNSGAAYTNARSRWAKRKLRKKMNKQNDANIVGEGEDKLDWESFEFGKSPKLDRRFQQEKVALILNDNANNIAVNEDSPRRSQNGTSDITDHNNTTFQTSDHILNTIPTSSLTYQQYLKSETLRDQNSALSLSQSHSALFSLSPATVEHSISTLKPFLLPRRIARIEEVLKKRTKHARFLFENPSNPSNVWACMRTLDSFGIQYVDVIISSNSYQGKAAVNQKRGMRTAMGSASWVTVRQFGSVVEALKQLRQEEGCLIYASDLNEKAKDVRDLTWDVDFDHCDKNIGDHGGSGINFGGSIGMSDGRLPRKKQRPICVVMGNEERGISDEMRMLSDETFYLPMCGFAESFNLSVATAITLAYMSAASDTASDRAKDNFTGYDEGGTSTGTCDRAMKGPLRPGDLDQHEFLCLKLKGMINSLAQKRMGKALLKKEGIILPNSIFT